MQSARRQREAPAAAIARRNVSSERSERETAAARRRQCRRLLAREVVRCVDLLGPAMPADNANGARLRALYPLLFGESDLRADL